MIELIDGKYVVNQDPFRFIPVWFFGREIGIEILMEKGIFLRDRYMNSHFDFEVKNWWIHIYE